MEPTNIVRAICSGRDIEISSKMPSKVQSTQAILVDMKHRTLGDLTADGNGKFKNDGTFRWNYIKESTDTYRCVRKKYRKAVPTNELASGTLVVVKTYFVHKENSNFRRMIAYVEDSRNDMVNNLALVGYLKSDNKPIILTPHGNSKRTHSYTKVKPSVVNICSQEAKSNTVTKALEQHIYNHGGRCEIAQEHRPTASQLYKASGTPIQCQPSDEFQVTFLLYF